MRLTVGKKIVFSFSVVIALITLIVGFSFYQLQQINNNTKMIIHDSIPLGRSAANLLSSLVEQETGVRGYVATGDEGFLEPYYAGDLKGDIERIEPLLDRHPIMAELIEEAKPKIQAIQEYFASLIVLVENGNIESARSKLADGKALFDSFRETNEEIQQDIDKLTNDSWVQVQNTESSAKTLIIIVTLVACIVSLI